MRLARTTRDDLKAWRDRHGLSNAELAVVFGITTRGITAKLYGERPIGVPMDRQLDACDLLLGLGAPPPGWPQRLRNRF